MENLKTALEVIEIEGQAVLALKSRISESFEKVIEVILACKGKVIFSGVGKSGLIGRKLASTFSSTGTPSFFLHAAEGLHGDLGAVAENDVLILISYGGELQEHALILELAKKRRVPVVVMTGTPQSLLAQNADLLLDVSVQREACPLELAPTASSTATLVLGDALAMAVMTAKGFNRENFAENHPGGSLGEKLKKVREKMHTGRGFVLVEKSTPIKTVVSKMSQTESRGAAGVVDLEGNLVGVITDGDLRRRLESSENPLTGTAVDLMNHTPKLIDASEYSEKALFLMEQFRINLLFVTDKKSEKPLHPVGVLHIQDLLKRNYK